MVSESQINYRFCYAFVTKILGTIINQLKKGSYWKWNAKSIGVYFWTAEKIYSLGIFQFLFVWFHMHLEAF